MRYVIRFLGLIMLAAGFIGIVIDGTRSMANTSLMFSSLNDLGGVLFPEALAALRSQILAFAPGWMWDPVCTGILRLPASVVGFVLGALILRLCEKGKTDGVIPGVPPLR